MISVIIPVYNAEKFIEKTITSILRQTYANFELILVDDGSNDQSGMICDRFAARDSRIKIIHEKNGGVSHARNEGLKYITGDYLTFIDADDYIEPEYFATAISLFEEHKDADALIFGLNIVKNSVRTASKLKTYGMETTTEYLKNVMLSSDTDFGGGYPFNKIWRISSKEEIVLFDETLWSKEDRLWVFQMLTGLDKVWLDDRIFYNYVYNEASLTHSKGAVSRNLVNGVEAFKKISLLDFHDSQLQNLSYFSFSRMLVYRFCIGLFYRDMSSVMTIYILYKKEWKKIFNCVFGHGKFKAKVEAVVCYVTGYSLCEVLRKRKS